MPLAVEDADAVATVIDQCNRQLAKEDCAVFEAFSSMAMEPGCGPQENGTGSATPRRFSPGAVPSRLVAVKGFALRSTSDDVALLDAALAHDQPLVRERAA